MTHALAARLAGLIHRLSSGAPAPDSHTQAIAPADLASLNQARRSAYHPTVPAYRHRHRTVKPAWPFPAGGANEPGA